MPWICSDEEECDGHLKILKDALKGMGCNAQLIDHQFQRATVKNRNSLLRRQIQNMTDRVPFVIQYFRSAEKLRHTLCSLQHIVDDNEHTAKIIPMPPLLAFKLRGPGSICGERSRVNMMRPISLFFGNEHFLFLFK
eukprot:g32837.t1